ncbi:retrotransposon protein, putative, ty1-copia subclass [Tanacetum coccineum]
MFQAKASKERLDIVKSLMACKPKHGAFICAFVLEMKGYFDRLKSLNMVFDAELSINIILPGLPTDYNHFVLSYQMNRKETSIMELHSLLQIVEQGINKIDVPFTSASPVLTVGHNAKKINRESKRKVESEIAPTSDPKEASLKESRRLKHGELNLVMGNKKIMYVTKIGKYKLILKSGLDKSKLWHSRLGHANKKCIAQLQKDEVLKSFDFKSDDVCESCLLGKMTKSPFTGMCERGEGLLDLVHTDVCGPFRSATKDGKRYYVTFTDDFSRYGYVYLIKHKSDTFEVLKRYQNEVENQLERKIKLTPPRTPQLNDVAERINRTLLDMDSGSKIDLEEIQEFADEEPIVNTDTQQEVVTPVEPDDISLPIRRTSSRVSKPPQFYYGFHIEEDKISDSTLSELDEPANYKEAMASPEAVKWKEAMKSEIQSMLVAKGYTQTHEIDFEETFSPMAKIKSVRIMLAIAVFHDYEIWLLVAGISASMRKSHSLDFLEAKMSLVYMSKSVGVLKYSWSKRLIGLSQDMYLDKILKRFKMENSKKGNLPLHHGIKISKDLCPKTDEELDKMSRVPYALVIGSIMYAMACTRHDVSFALSMQTDKDDSRSVSSCVFLLNGGVVTWKSSKQYIVSSAVALDGTLCLVDQDRLRPIIVDDLSKRRKIPNLDPLAGIFANHLRSSYECDFVSLDSRLNSKKSNMDHSFGSDEEVDHVRILQFCNGLLLCTGSTWPVFYYVYNPSPNLFKRLLQPNYTHDDSGFYSVLRMAFDLRKSLYYKVVQAEHASEGLNRKLKHCKLNIEDHDHLIITTLDIPYELHRGRNFLESFGGPSGDPILLLMEIPHMLHLEGKFFESCGCLLLVCRDNIGSTEFTIYEMMKGSSVWSVRYLVNTEELMNPLPEGWSIQKSVWCIGLGEGEEDAFLVINLSGKFIPPFEVDPNLYEFIPSLASV